MREVYSTKYLLVTEAMDSVWIAFPMLDEQRTFKTVTLFL